VAHGVVVGVVTITADEIRAIATYLRSDTPAYRSLRYSTDIDPWWLETPERRSLLWRMMERVAALEED
jgi:hypothetical protein